MNALVSPPRDSAPDRASGPLLRTLVLCDLVDSTALVERLGDQRAAALMRRHDRLARDLVQRHGGQEIDKTDGFLVLFERPIQGVAFALDYQRELRQLGRHEQLDLRARVGVHVGDVLVWENSAADVAHGAKPVEVEGLVKPVAARLAGLALPGQILASGVAANLAQRAHAELGEKENSAQWINHGRYRFKGVPEPLPVYEIGEADIAPMQAPPWSSKAHREVPWWRRPATVAVEMTLLLGGLAAVTWWALRPPPAIAFAERDWVVMGSLRNLTSERKFDDALQTAFRIGLEQSRFVNLLPELQVRDTLQRMQRDPATPVDRDIGSEIALREGARAVILPTVTEIGGRLRVTAEVVDPETQATVYSDSSEGVGSESVLGSLDTVGQRVRARLGESLAAIRTDAQPLPKVSAQNLDALRAFSLGQKAFLENRYGDALSLYSQALRLDEGFAMARMGRARIYLGSGDSKAGRDELQRVVPLREHLPPREAMYFDALLATLHAPAERLEKWKLLASIYPDLYYAHTNYALFAWQLFNDYPGAIEAVKRSLNPHNTSLGASHYLLATLDLGTERLAEAALELKAARQHGRPLGYVDVQLDAAARRFDQAQRTLDAVAGSGVDSNDIDRYQEQIALSADRGDFDKAFATVVSAQHAADKVSDLHRRLYFGIEVSLRVIHKLDDAVAVALRRYVDSEVRASVNADDPDRAEAAFSAQFGAYLLAHAGQMAAADEAIARTSETVKSLHFPMVGKMQTIAMAEVRRHRGEPAQGSALLVDGMDGTEPYLAHAALKDAWIDLREWSKALSEAQWLVTHRGRAYTECGSNFLQRTYYVLLSDIALLEAAELSERLNDTAGARRYLRDFDALWPSAAVPALLAARGAALHDKLR